MNWAIDIVKLRRSECNTAFLFKKGERCQQRVGEKCLLFMRGNEKTRRRHQEAKNLPRFHQVFSVAVLGDRARVRIC